MQTFKLTIITPDTTLFDSEAIAVILPGSEGSFEILPNHTSIVAMIKSGTLEITNTAKEKIQLVIPGGFFEFQHNEGVLLCTPLQ